LPIPAQRFGYRLAHRLLRLTWFFTRPHKQGVKCLLTERDRVLLVRHTYGERWWDMPGGHIERGEPPAATAQRELHEELGLEVEPEALEPVTVLDGSLYHRRDDLHVFRVELSSPQLAVAAGEIAAARWFERAALPADLSPLVIPALARTTVRRPN
jgi:8-oxo-dGTP pyrophosphatase MutT (NUDIX family)